MRLGIIGQPCIDEIVAPDGTSGARSLGGIFYSYAAMDHFMRSSPNDTFMGLSWHSIPDENILAPFINSLARLEITPNFMTDELTNRVRLIYDNDASRKEECSIILPPLTIKEFSQADIGTLDGLFVNMISGFDLSLETLEWVRAHTYTHIHLDVHALILGDVSTRIGEARIPHGVRDWRRWLNCADTVQMNELEARWFASPDLDSETKMIEAVRDSTVKALVITRAERGASCFLSDREFHIESPPITVIDPTGSGDVFGSAFLYRLAQSQDYEVALAFAVRSASQNCELNGVTDWGLLNFAH